MADTFVNQDALGNPVEIGKSYGYSSTSSGRAKTTVGVAEKFSKTGQVTLRVTEVKHFLYGQQFERSWPDAEKVSIRPYMLFPVNHENRSTS
jgi:hypothetical protein